MYENHFSFKHKPFDLVPNPDFLFLSSTHRKAIMYLDYGIKERIGFILITGEIGSGKTTIIRNLIKNLDSSVRLSRINNTKVSSEQLIAMINEDFGLDIDGKNKTKLLSELNGFLIKQYANKIQPVVLIDEAQNLSPDLLEEVRLLSNLETDRAKLLQIILVGQPELKDTLMLPELLQLRQRINISYHIAPLTIDETSGYLKHRLAVAGNPNAMILDNNMLDVIYRFSRGIPRLINILCDFALLSSYAEGKKEVTAETVTEVAKDIESGDYWNESRKLESHGKDSTQQGYDLSKVTGDLLLRLVKLEETVANNITEIISLTNKVIRLEVDIAKLVNVLGSKRMTELLEQTGKGESIATAGSTSGISGGLRKGNEDQVHHLEGEIESLTKTIHFLNDRLKSI